MELLAVVVRLVVIVGAMLGAGVLWLVGPARFARALSEWRSRSADVVPFLGLLLVVIALRLFVERLQVWLSWQIGFNITGTLYAIEGEFVAAVQSMQSPALTDVLIFMYLYGYVFLLLFPIVAYFCLEDMRSLSELLSAFAVNYAIGLLLYTAFVAYGPRNLILDMVDPLLYTAYPQSRALTNAVNHNVNVFPSLHTSMSVTALVMAWRTRDVYPQWVPIAAVLATGVIFSTMYLAIHWALDVAGGIALGVASVYLGVRIVDRYRESIDLRNTSARASAALRR